MKQLLALPVHYVGPVPFNVGRFDEVVEAICESPKGLSSGIAVHFANAYSVALADRDPGYSSLLADRSSVVFTDGMPVAWVGRRFYPGVATNWDRVYGPDVMEAVLERGVGLRHFLLGGSPKTLVGLKASITHRWPDAEVVGSDSPPFHPMAPTELAKQDELIRQSGADVIWVGLGTPKQDWEAARLARSFPAVVLAVGAAFDFIAGVKPQAPVWMQKSGTEWAFRLATEPRRLAIRYLWGNPRFMLSAFRHRPVP